MIQVTNVFCVLYIYNGASAVFEYNKWLILLSVIQLSGGYCLYLQIFFSRLTSEEGEMWLTLFGLALISTQSFSQDGKESKSCDIKIYCLADCNIITESLFSVSQSPGS
jgi:hypothetical protein